MMPLDEMREFVHDKIFEALHRLLGELEVQPDTAGGSVATAPLGFHFLDATLSDLNTQRLLPFFEKGRQQFLELLAIPPLQHALAERVLDLVKNQNEY